MKSVRDNGSQATAELASRVNELTDRVHHQRMRMALIRKALRDNRILDKHLEEHKRYIEALEGHVSGLEHNIEVLKESLIASEAKYQAVLGAKSVRMATRLRSLIHSIAQPSKKGS